MSIVVEEADEAGFWLEFIVEANLLKESQVVSLINEAKELTAIFMASRKTVNERSPEFVADIKVI